jgi:putative PIN family toxin of toxin-antitoxin system
VRLVLDTSVIVSAFRSRNGASRQLFAELTQRRFIVIATPACFLEYEEVLSRPEQAGIHGYSTPDIDKFLNALARYTELVQVNYTYRPQLRDPDDEFILEAAINGFADIIATFNVNDFLPEASHFGIEVLPPGRIIKERLS